MNSKKAVSDIFLASIRAVDPFLLVKDHLGKALRDLRLDLYGQIHLIGFGKASFQMVAAAQELVHNSGVSGSLVITKYGHALVKDTGYSIQDTCKLKVFEAGHPIPDDNGLKATEEVIRLMKQSDSQTLILFFISGGGSALLVSPLDRITLSEKQVVTELLLRAGADIKELNTVRKHISKVKGGRLAEIASPATIVSFLISDVVGDSLDIIASGPTVPDSSSFQDALSVIEKYDLTARMPVSVMDIISRGMKGLIPETPKQDNVLFQNVSNRIIGNNLMALRAAHDSALSRGYEPEIHCTGLTGEAREAGKRLARIALEKRSDSSTGPLRSLCLISGGETTVTVKGKGKGGRNTELALGFALEIEGIQGITLLSAGTDGTDGPTDAAGAVVNGDTLSSARRSGLDPLKYLEDNDSYHFFKQVGDLIFTGPTGTNVMDMQIILIDERV
jgi:hydroxypyruvate reductase/glycerate 2-kinase